MTAKSTNRPEINSHLWVVFSNHRAKTCTIAQPTAAILYTREVCFPLKLTAWIYGYTTRTQPKIGRTKLMFSENSPSYELPPCCDVMELSNLITVPQPRSQGLSSLPPLVVGRKTLVAAGHVPSCDTNFSTGVGSPTIFVDLN